MANSSEAQSLTDEPCISIIITTLNEEKFISGCLASCLEQKNIGFKIILVDGGSTDLTLKIASSILRPCDDIISLPGSSIYEAWNQGIVTERTPWLCFLGADDAWSSKYSLSALYSFALAGSCSFVCCKSYLYDRSTPPFTNLLTIRGSYYSRQAHLKGKLSISHPGALYSRSLFEEFGLYDTSYSIIGDSEHLLRCDNSNFGFIPLPLVKVTASGLSMKSKYRHYIELARQMKSYLTPSSLIPLFYVCLKIVFFKFAKR